MAVNCAECDRVSHEKGDGNHQGDPPFLGLVIGTRSIDSIPIARGRQDHSGPGHGK